MPLHSILRTSVLRSLPKEDFPSLGDFGSLLARRLAIAASAVSLAVVVVFAAGPAEAETRSPTSGRVLALCLPDQDNPKIAAMQARMYRAMQDQARYLLGIVRTWDKDPAMRLLTDSRSQEHWIRPNTGAVQGYCFLFRFGPYDEKIVGVSRRDLLEKTIVPMMRYLVATHRTGTRTTGDGKPWGDAWQSAHWAQMLGRGAWWVWDDLPDDLRQGVRRVVAHEAGRFVRAQPPHRIRGDTKAEENAWNAQIFSVAVLLMPDDPRRGDWEKAFQKWVLSSFLRPADAESDTVVDGRPVREQFTGACVYDDYTLENHGFIHPDYMTTFSLSLGCGVDYAMSGRRPPEALLFNVAGIYENLKWFVLPDGGFVYPNGQDWTLFRHPGWTHVHTLMAAYGRDPDAWQLVERSVAAMEKMQARNASGAIFCQGEYFFPSTQTDRMVALSCDWLVLQGAKDVPDDYSERFGVRRLDAGKVVLHRTPAAVNTFSWGAKVMAQCVPFRLDRIVSPDQRSGLGHIRLAGQKKALPVKLREVKVESGTDGFTARLVVDHGTPFRAELEFRSASDGTWHAREKLTALADATTAEVATGLVGILNNPEWIYEKGRRRIAIDGPEHLIPAHSGKVLEADSARRISIDSVLVFESPRPLGVRYVGATGPERGRATDRLYLNYLGGKRKWKEGEVLSEYEVTVRQAPSPAGRGPG